MRKRNFDGFTLGELLIVVAIIGVLVSISVPMYQNKLQRTADVVNKANIRTARATGMHAYYRGYYTDSADFGGGPRVTEIINGNDPYERYRLIGSKDENGGAFYYFLDSNIFGYQWANFFEPQDLTYEKKNGVYRQILVECFEENGELIIKTKPYIDDQGNVRLAFAEQGTPYDQAEHNKHGEWGKECDEQIEKKWNNEIKILSK